ncbi:hypothetical protein [Vreelandella hamiltonii]|uniref:Uncharacterized protein n=1 Tax=Halomonas johnsoniae TaxID=502832 RepID=A0ABQ2WPD1_9GAMM|nr:hypothetical protein [Halomonas johnsoniae]GGW65486.1 hypothetical protein GCM10007158_27760 [Halomonas johnsoniae]
MTVVVSWTRKTNTGRELWVMSDSRLSGGKCWDYGPKIFGMGRSDAVVAFAGDTAWSYPLIAQVTSYVESFINLRERAVDFIDARKKIIRMLNESLNFVSDAADPSLEVPDCTFIFAGYSARKKEFMINKVVFNSKRKKFELKPSKEINGELLAVIGDKKPVSAISRIVSEGEKKNTKTGFKLDMIPSEAFVKVLSSKRFREIGGAPQLTKIYQNMNQQHIGVYWPPELPHDEQKIYLRGRELGKYEALDHPWVFDPSSNKLYWHDFSPIEMQAKAKVERQPVIVSYISEPNK